MLAELVAKKKHVRREENGKLSLKMKLSFCFLVKVSTGEWAEISQEFN